VNLGSTDERTIRELAEIVLEIVDTESGIVYEDLPEDDPEVRRPDLTKVTDLTGWEPSVELRDGLTRTLNYLRAQY